MTIDVNIKDAEQFITSEKFTIFLTSNTTDFGTAAFVLQTLLDKIDEIKNNNDEQGDLPNWDKAGKWEINPDGYYLVCPFCKEEEYTDSTNKDRRCHNCGAWLEV